MGMVRNRAKTTAALISELKSDPTVESVEPNYLRYTSALPNDTRFNELWALRNNGQTVNDDPGTSGADIKYEAAWAKAREVTGEVVVGVIDTGTDVTHPDLEPSIWKNALEIPNNNLDDDGNGYVDDYHGFDFEGNVSDLSDSGDHGTHVAGTIAAKSNNGAGIAGVNDRAKIMVLKVSADGDSISTSAVVEAIEYAIAMKQRGVPIVALNASYGGSSSSNLENNAIASAGSEGIILCAAAGNDELNNNLNPSYPASYNQPNIITVAASDQNDALSDFSNYGSTSVDLAAPGSNILSTVPTEINLKVGAGSYSALPMTFSGQVTGLTGQIINCGIGRPEDIPSSVNGNIALIERGSLDFSVKVANVQAAGAIAAVIYNNVAGQFGGTLQTASDWIPAVSISRVSGVTIRSALPTTGSFEVTQGYQFLDGTSMAAPHVTGAVAFAAMNFPNETMAQRVQRILSSVDVTPGLQGKVITNGRLNLNRVVDNNQDGIADWQANALTFTNLSQLKGGVVSTSYSETLTTNQGTAPFDFSLVNGALPAGLSFSDSGELTGIPTEAGTYTFTILVTDSNQNSGGRVFTLVVVAEAPQITTITPLPDILTEASYFTSFAGAGGTPPYTWSVVSGNLPPGLSLSSNGTLSGFPATAGTSTFTVKMIDAHQLIAEKEISLTVNLSPITILNAPELLYGIRNLAYSQTLLAEGGTGSYIWTRISGNLPTGLQLSQLGVLSGKPTTPGNYTFRIEVRDGTNVITSKLFTLNIRSVYSAPQITSFDLGSTYIGAEYMAAIVATDYPQSFKVTGLPSGLTYSTKTGIISGRPKQAGEFTVQATAKNPAGTSQTMTALLTVRDLAPEWIGNFTGYITRDSTVNQNVGSRLSLTTTALGSYTVKVSTGSSSKSARGYLNETDPQISVLIHGQTLKLWLGKDSQLVTGTHGIASVSGWRIPWNARSNAANQHVGYYSAALNPVEMGDQDPAEIPQGSGYMTVNVNTAGTVSIAGRTATGDKITTSGGMGPGGEALAYQALYKYKGSILGGFTVNSNGDDLTDNSLTGSLSWLKPADTSRVYTNGFGPLTIGLAGGYLAPKSSGSVVQGLPATGSNSLGFSDGGLALSETNPNVTDFGFSPTFLITMPDGGSTANPAYTSLKINKSTGAISGTFLLEETSPVLKRKVSFQGMIVPQNPDGIKAQGYFLLPQIPMNGQKSTNSPILSGGVKILSSSSPQ